MPTTLTENKYEDKLLSDLPLNARDIAVNFFTHSSLKEMLVKLQEKEPDLDVLKEYKVSPEHWIAILQAAILAKTTCFLPQKSFSQQEILYMVKIVCICIDYPTDDFSIVAVADYTKEDMPILHDWLLNLSRIKT